jgi:hypothetical protein
MTMTQEIPLMAEELRLEQSRRRQMHWKRWGNVVQVFGQQTPEEHSLASHR